MPLFCVRNLCRTSFANIYLALFGLVTSTSSVDGNPTDVSVDNAENKMESSVMSNDKTETAVKKESSIKTAIPKVQKKVCLLRILFVALIY